MKVRFHSPPTPWLRAHHPAEAERSTRVERSICALELKVHRAHLGVQSHLNVAVLSLKHNPLRGQPVRVAAFVGQKGERKQGDRTPAQLSHVRWDGRAEGAQCPRWISRNVNARRQKSGRIRIVAPSFRDL